MGRLRFPVFAALLVMCSPVLTATPAIGELHLFDAIRVSVPDGGGGADGDSGLPAVSADGSVVAYGSTATNLTLEWTRLPAESWDEQLGCSLAARRTWYDDNPFLEVRAGNQKDYLDQAAPAVVRFFKADVEGAMWIRDGAVNVGFPRIARCPSIAGAADYDATVMEWGDGRALFIDRWDGPLSSDLDLFFPPPAMDYSSHWPGTLVDVSADGTVAVVYRSLAGAMGVEVLRPSGEDWTRRSLPTPDWVSGVAVAEDYVAVVSARSIRVYLKSDLDKNPVPYREIVVPGDQAFFSTIDADGQRIVVGAPEAVPGGPNEAHVITLDGDSWNHVQLPRSDYADEFGTAVAIEGTRIAVGAYNDGEGGSVYLYEWDGSRWHEEKIPSFLGPGQRFGWTVALAGQTLAVGAPTGALGGGGSVWVTTLEDRGRFIDDDDSVFVADIEWLAGEGITKGCNPPLNTLFCPDDSVTRGQMAAFLARALDLTDDGGGNSFIDDNGSIFEADIAKLAAAGITKGCNPPVNDMFCPNDPVTRGQMAAFLVRALGYMDDGGGNLFTDDDGSIFETSIDKLATAGVTRGCNPPVDDMFCPHSNVTRGQMAAFLHRALG